MSRDINNGDEIVKKIINVEVKAVCLLNCFFKKFIFIAYGNTSYKKIKT